MIDSILFLPLKNMKIISYFNFSENGTNQKFKKKWFFTSVYWNIVHILSLTDYSKSKRHCDSNDIICLFNRDYLVYWSIYNSAQPGKGSCFLREI